MARLSNPFIQYLDGNGKPYAGAKLYFYEPGTTTLKDTYSDAGMQIPNPNPVVADSSGRFGDTFISGIYKTVLKTSGDVVVAEADPVGISQDGQFTLWVNDKAYDIPDIVIGSDNLFYQSIIDNNQGNDPTTSPGQWDLSGLTTPANLVDGDIGVTVQAYSSELDDVAANGLGSGANQIVQLNASAQIPALDGSLVTKLVLGVGYSQTGLDVKASRSVSTLYTNTSGRPKEVCVAINYTGSVQGYITRGGLDLVTNMIGAATATGMYTFIVPNGTSYGVYLSAGSINQWVEAVL